jgi:hypothetical protein
MTTVTWTPFIPAKYKGSKEWYTLAAIEPEPVIPYIMENRTMTGGTYLNCPAFLAYYKNTYVIKSPCDVEFQFNHDSQSIWVANQSQEFFDTCIIHRFSPEMIRDPFLVSLNFQYQFETDVPCLIESMPSAFHESEFVSKTRIISGQFDFHKWPRPIECAFEVTNKEPTISIKRGDPLFYVRLTPQDGSKISLEYKEQTDTMQERVRSLGLFKNVVRKMPLSYLYKIAERFTRSK